MERAFRPWLGARLRQRAVLSQRAQEPAGRARQPVLQPRLQLHVRARRRHGLLRVPLPLHLLVPPGVPRRPPGAPVRRPLCAEGRALQDHLGRGLRAPRGLGDAGAPPGGAAGVRGATEAAGGGHGARPPRGVKRLLDDARLRAVPVLPGAGGSAAAADLRLAPGAHAEPRWRDPRQLPMWPGRPGPQPQLHASRPVSAPDDLQPEEAALRAPGGSVSGLPWPLEKGGYLLLRRPPSPWRSSECRDPTVASPLLPRFG
mmetsp:Transcript_93371/g.273355  ORF Transcript_93371/g.273355 Transcript_93371/m.273355 type:complete len:258 (+) Transcript_93371:786-1559(+)